MKILYLDNNATTQVAPEVLEAMLPYLGDLYGNPSSAHTFGGRVGRKIRAAREQVAALIGAMPEEIVFTGCGSESDNTAIRSALATESGKRHVVTSRVEHPAVKSLCAHLMKEGYRVTEIPVNSEGLLDMDRYQKSLTPDTAMVSLMWANNETGVIFPVEKAAEMAQEEGNPVSYRCGPDRGQDPHRHERKRGGHAILVGSQAPRGQGHGGPLRAEGHKVFSFPPRRSPGRRS